MDLRRLVVWAIGIAALVAAAGCAPPSQRDPARYGRVTVFFPPNDWASSYLDIFRSQLPVLERLGPEVVETSQQAGASVVVQHWDSGDGCTLGAGRWLVGTNVVQIDPVCCEGETALRAALGHEVGHALGMAHVCRVAGEAPDCSSVGFGEALMNPSLRATSDPDPGPGFDTVYSPDLPTSEPTDLDLAEYRRVHP